MKKNNLPDEESLFKQIMLTIRTTWKNNISKDDIERWLDNFNGKVFDIKYERQLSLLLLSNFVFYNEKEVKHLCRTLYKDFRHHLLLTENHSGNNCITILKEIENRTKFFPLGLPGESGYYIFYYFRHINNLSNSNIVERFPQINDSNEILVFLDDVTITASQAEPYIKKIMNERSINCKKKFLLTLFSAPKAVSLLMENKLYVISCVHLDDRCKCFSDKSSVFHHFSNHLTDCKKMAYIYGRELLPNHPLGYDGGEYLFGFFYNTPDNTLPIFWADKNGWFPIFKRFNIKNSRTNIMETNYERERFI
jgi:hypothetical protein